MSKPIRVEDENEDQVDIKDEIYSRTNSNKETVFFRNDKKTIGMYRSALKNTTLTVWYVPKPALFDIIEPINISQIFTDIDDDYQELIILQATVIALGTDEDNVAYWKNEFEQEWLDFVSSHSMKSELAQLPVDYYGETESQYI